MAEASVRAAKNLKRDRDSKHFSEVLMCENTQDEDFFQKIMKTPEKNKHKAPSQSLLNTPVLSDSQLQDITRPIKKATRFLAYVAELWVLSSIPESRADFDAEKIRKMPGSGFGMNGCAGCQKANTCCNACIFFLPKQTRKRLFEKIGRKENLHYCNDEGMCKLCQLMMPGNQICSRNYYFDNGDCDVQQDKWFCEEVESRWREMVRAGVELGPRARERVDIELYGPGAVPHGSDALGFIIQEADKVGKKRRTKKIDGENGPGTDAKIKKSMVSESEARRQACLASAALSSWRSSASEPFTLPPREKCSAEIEQWPLRAANEMQLEGGETKSISTIISIPDLSSSNSYLKIESLREDHWLSTSFNKLISIRTGVLMHSQHGRIKVTLHNKTDKPFVVRKTMVLGMLIREKYLDMCDKDYD